MLKIKGSFYKQYLDKINNKHEPFYKERLHLQNTYNIDKDTLDKVFDNFYNIINTNKDDLYISTDKEYCPDYAYEKDMLKSFEEFKEELVYDGYLDLARMVSLSHFYLLFQYGYNPCF